MNTADVNSEKAEFQPPSFERWGTVHNLTAVGNTTEGEDEFPGEANFTGSVCPGDGSGPQEFC